MAWRLLGSLIRGTIRARNCSSSSGMSVKGLVGSAAWSEAAALHGPRNAFFHADGRNKPVAAAAAALSAFAGFRSLHSRAAAHTAQIFRARDGSFLPGIDVQGSLGLAAGTGARRLHVLRDVVIEHSDGAVAVLSVAVFSVIAGITYLMKDDLDKAQDVDHQKTGAYTCTNQLMHEMELERALYNRTMPDKKKVVEEYMEDVQAMRARFEEWMKKHGRTYQDEVEKARRFKIFKSVARFVDAGNAEAAQAGHSVRFGLNKFSDWNEKEMSKLYGIPTLSDEDYLQVVKPYLVEQGIWHKVSNAMNQQQHKQESED